MPASNSRATSPLVLGSPKTSERTAIGSWATGPIVLIHNAAIPDPPFYINPYAVEADTQASTDHTSITEVPDGARYLDMYYMHSGISEDPTTFPVVRVYGGHRRSESPDTPIRVGADLTRFSRRWPSDVNPWFSNFNVFWKRLRFLNPSNPMAPWEYEYFTSTDSLAQSLSSPNSTFPNVGGITSGTLSRFRMSDHATVELLGSEVVMPVIKSPAVGPEHNLIVGIFRF